ncbi:MAG: hypothetical protein OQJ97_16900 [Rhodospirillales bacterium]|nr:hypothetical protein [Rhodospirillales bacterium]
MLKNFLLYLFPLLVMPSVVEAKTRCPASHDPVEVTFQVKEGRVIERFDLSRAQMSSFIRSSRSTQISEGYTQMRYKQNLSVSVVSGGGNGKGCAYLKAVSLKVNISDIKVFIAREHKPGSCPFKVTRDHEDEHVNIIQSAFDNYLPQVEAKLERVAWNMKPVSTRSVNQASKKILNQLQRAVQPIFDRMDRQMHRQNAAIDTRESYIALSAQCDDW